MKPRDRIALDYEFWNGDPATEPIGNLDDILDNLSESQEEDVDDKR